MPDIVEPRIRPATAADADVVLELAGELAITFVTEPAAFRESYRSLVGAQDTDLLVVEPGGRVWGVEFEHMFD